jgi:hypothetical protein
MARPLPTEPTEPVEKDWRGLIMLALLAVLTSAFILHMGRLSTFLGPSGRSIVLAVELAVIAGGAVACFAQRLYGILGLAAAFVLYLVFQAHLFSWNFQTPVNLNNLSGFFGLLSVLVFAPALVWARPPAITNVILVAAVLYAAYYLLLSLEAPGFRPPASTEPDILTISADLRLGRPERFVMLAGLMGFGAFVCLSRIVRRSQWTYLPLLILFAAGVWLSYSRAITAILLATAACYVLVRSARWIGHAYLIGFIVLGGALVIGLSNPTFRPFAGFSPYDMSAYARDMSYGVVRSLFPDYWIMGVGLVSNPGDIPRITGTEVFFSSDLGPVGVLFDCGAVGLILYAVLHGVAATSARRLDAVGFDPADSDALALTGAAFALYGVIAPDLWAGGSTLFAGLLVAVAARSAQASQPWRTAEGRSALISAR